MASAERSILFFAKDPHNVVVYERVLRRLFADPRIRVYLSSKNDHTRPANALFDAFDFPRRSRIHHRLASPRRFDLYLSPDIYLLGKRSRVKAHTFHGISIKGKAYTDKALAYDRLFLIGPYQRERFAERGILERDDSRYAEIGMPKTDGFFDGSLDRGRYLEGLGLDPARPAILYAPTWRPESSLNRIGEELVRLMKGAPWSLLIKLHDLTLADPRPIDWRRWLAAIDAPNIRAIDDLDVTPAMFAADLLISDASSVANEFTLLDRPIVFAAVPELLAKYGEGVDLERWGQSSGPVASDAAEILRCVEASLADASPYAEARRRIAAEGFFNPGRATDAALREIHRLIRLDFPDSDAVS